MHSITDISKIIHTKAALQKLSEKEVTELKNLYPELPSEYFRLLAEIGHGNLGILILYKAPMDPINIYTSARSNMLNGIILFGDDMQGFCYGFDMQNNGRVVEIDPRGHIDRTIEPEFVDFLMSFLS